MLLLKWNISTFLLSEFELKRSEQSIEKKLTNISHIKIKRTAAEICSDLVMFALPEQ